jgi:hypothetical protein
MLTIRNAQMAVFENESRETFIARMVAKIKSEFPDSYRDIGEAGAAGFVRESMIKAAAKQVYSQDAVAILIELLLDFGNDFVRAPERKWAKRMLEHTSLPDHIRLIEIRDRMAKFTQGRRIIQAKPSRATRVATA